MSAAKRLERTIRRWIATASSELNRTKRVIVPPETRLACKNPVFILGVHRSGTTLLRLILDSHSKIACPPESLFLRPLQSLLNDPLAMEGLAAMGFDQPHVVQRLRSFVAYFFETYAASKGKARWADKTPAYLECLDLIESLFGPECRYIVIFRHGLDVSCSLAGISIPDVEPYIEACDGDRFRAAARFWSARGNALWEFRNQNRDRCIDLRYEDLVSEPEPALRRLFGLLGEPWEPQVLRFNDQPHDFWIGLQDRRAAETRLMEPRIGVWKDQSADVVEIMREEAGGLLAELGYE